MSVTPWRAYLGASPESILLDLDALKPPINILSVVETLGIHLHQVYDPGWQGAHRVTENRVDLWLRIEVPERDKRLQCAHQLGHILLHETECRRCVGWRSYTKEEEEASDFALAILMPRTIVKSRVRKFGPDAGVIASIFDVTETAAAIRLGQLYG